MKKLTVLVLLCFLLSAAVHGASVHGTIYDQQLESVKNVVIEINSTPTQRHISKYGGYSFELEPGNYVITAYTKEYFAKAIAKEEVNITSDGDYNVDLFVSPGINITSKDSVLDNIALIPWLLVIIAALLIIGIFIIGRWLFTRVRKSDVEYNFQVQDPEVVHATSEIATEETEASVDVTFTSEDDKLKSRVLTMLKENENKLTQKDIRKKTQLSEAKVSLIVSELEKEGKVQKVKKGRTNIIVAKN